MAKEIEEYSYEGDELALFAHATRWKSYFSSRIRPFLQGDVLEVGAGIGGTTRILHNDRVKRWVCLEPDQEMVEVLKEDVAVGNLPANCEVAKGILPTDQLEQASFDAILYIDVLEHIDKDKLEVEVASRYLKKGGFLIILSPAHNWLFSPFDKALGHFRRYNKKMLSALTPDNMVSVRVEYLDSVGLFASLANRMMLRQSAPSMEQISFWDKKMVPISKLVDRVIRWRFGKSIIIVWKKTR